MEMRGGARYPRHGRPPTWEQFRAAVRRVDRDSLLINAAGASSLIARGLDPEEWQAHGLTPWTIADVARTALAWGGFARPEADMETLALLGNMNVQIADEVNDPEDASSERVGRMLTRIIFEQFPGQRGVMDEVARTVLLFGSRARFPEGFRAKKMVPDWFAGITQNLSLEQYVESVLMIAVIAERCNGAFSLDWLDKPPLSDLADVLDAGSIRNTFEGLLLTTVDEFKMTNRRQQDPVKSAQKKYAFNPLADKPFIQGIAPTPIAPWVQAVIAKALPPAIYHRGLSALGEGFTRDLGAVFQEYTGRQLDVLAEGHVHPEVAYGSKKTRQDSCDWFLDLPGVLVLVECKARQPNEELRTRGADWLDSVTGSIGKGVRQLNRSNTDFQKISAVCPQIDPAKPRVGLVVTLEPFYINQNWFMWEHLERSEFPVGIVSIGELESLVTLDPAELSELLLGAVAAARSSEVLEDSLLLLNPALTTADGRENPLLREAWDSIELFDRIDRAAERLRLDASA
ncbi:hypothetical protein [Microbacterium sp.]|uniref:hypothetical protein n=1 Tax=Microbacterium sp. TaxID=51671 RepID=UPI003F9DFF2B